jgi:hypothetical protein
MQFVLDYGVHAGWCVGSWRRANNKRMQERKI